MSFRTPLFLFGWGQNSYWVKSHLMNLDIFNIWLEWIDYTNRYIMPYMHEDLDST